MFMLIVTSRPLMILLWALVACTLRVHVCVFAMFYHSVAIEFSSFFVSTSLPRRHRIKTNEKEERERCIISIPRCGTVCCTAALSNSMEWWRQWMSKHSLNFSWSDTMCACSHNICKRPLLPRSAVSGAYGGSKFSFCCRYILCR